MPKCYRIFCYNEPSTRPSFSYVIRGLLIQTVMSSKPMHFGGDRERHQTGGGGKNKGNREKATVANETITKTSGPRPSTRPRLINKENIFTRRTNKKNTKYHSFLYWTRRMEPSVAHSPSKMGKFKINSPLPFLVNLIRLDIHTLEIKKGGRWKIGSLSFLRHASITKEKRLEKGFLANPLSGLKSVQGKTKRKKHRWKSAFFLWKNKTKNSPALSIWKLPKSERDQLRTRTMSTTTLGWIENEKRQFLIESHTLATRRIDRSIYWLMGNKPSLKGER